MNIITNKRLSGNQFYPTAQRKTQIFIHHTAGTNVEGALNFWNQTPEHVGTAYIIGRDGNIYNVFEDNRWAYHLGVKHDDDYIEKNSIGIELVAAGHLYPEGNKYIFYPIWPKKISAKEIPSSEVFNVEIPWKGFRSFQIYTSQQLQALQELLLMLIKKYSITLQENLEGWGSYNPKVFQDHLPGIYSHSSVRIDKEDVFPYPPILDMLREVFSEIKGIKVSPDPIVIPEVPNSDRETIPPIPNPDLNTFGKRKRNKDV